MTKPSKLTEKGVRMPEIRLSQWEKIFPAYLQQVDDPNISESAKSHRFAMLYQQLFGDEPGFIENYSRGIEKSIKVKNKDRILKGRADNLFGNIIIEFKKNLPKQQAEAEDELRRYVAILWSEEPIDARTPYLCLATDGVRFISYSPIHVKPGEQVVAPEHLNLNALETTDWNRLKSSPEEIYFWLDRYFIRQEKYHPTSERIVGEFGTHSHAFQTANAVLLSLWQGIKDKDPFAVIFGEWEKYLRIVYGSKVSGEELFIRHTYLATLAKLMAWMLLSGSDTLSEPHQIVELLEGRLFKAQGIENFLEEDFFSWLARPVAAEAAVGVVRRLSSLLKDYNLRELAKEGEDVWKSLYQELVDPETRHDLGEFYTPDWLAHRMVNKMLQCNPRASTFDPACGSGTFLYLAIREKRRLLKDSQDTLNHIIDSVVGCDIHPLAVIIAKTNYILALGDLLKKHRQTISIPVYLADTINLPQRYMKGPEYLITLDDQNTYVPEELMNNLATYDEAMEKAKEFAKDNRDRRVTLDLFHNFLKAQNFSAHDDRFLVKKIYEIVKILQRLIERGRDTIWAFVLKNRFKPLFFQNRFDFLMGNPPWIAFRYLDPSYQDFVRRMVTDEYRLLSGKGHLITHLEVATLFLLRAADLYLKKGGTIAFVMPRSLFSADQHDGLRRGEYRFIQDTLSRLNWTELWDCDQVKPLFNVPSCVLWGEKREIVEVNQPIPGEVLTGNLSRKNASLAEAEKSLKIAASEFSLNRHGRRSYWAPGEGVHIKTGSWYKSSFYQGASIVPRSFWFVEVKSSPLGFKAELPPLVTASRAMAEAKAPYKDVKFEGNVESRFLYATLLSSDLLPFGHLDFRMVVLPLETEKDRYRLLDVKEARSRGFVHLTKWVEKAEIEWQKRRAAGSEKITALKWLDYRRKLTVQKPKVLYRVIYNTSGTILTSTIVKNEPFHFRANGQQITLHGVIADTKTYFYETNNIKEAFYLTSLLNAPIIDNLLKPMQSRGLWGPRDIHKKVLELPLPKFDAANPTHQHLAQLGEYCAQKVQTWLAQGGPGKVTGIGRLRQLVRRMLNAELTEIDGLVEKILR